MERRGCPTSSFLLLVSELTIELTKTMPFNRLHISCHIIVLVVNRTITQNDNNERYARPTGTRLESV